jgi:hypothetical protein
MSENLLRKAESRTANVDAPTAAKQDQDVDTPTQAENITNIAPQVSTLEKLKALAINDKVGELREKMVGARFVAGRMAMAGEITVFYAGPNTGKTLVTLKLVSEMLASNPEIDNVFHINLDDTFDGAITKADLGNRFGFKVLTPNQFTDPVTNFTEIVNSLVAEGGAKGVLLILDTVKKFADVMDKKASTLFMSMCRKFTSSGGTIIALAHTNKHNGPDEKGIPAGTSDTLDDCDCAYVINTVSEDAIDGGLARTIEFTNKKNRGPVVQSAMYRYEVLEGADYEDIFNSVKLLDGNDAEQALANKALTYEKATDQVVIDAISAAIGSGALSQAEIVESVNAAPLGSVSRRNVVSCLKRWNCPKEEGGVWTVTKGPSNTHHYSLI